MQLNFTPQSGLLFAAGMTLPGNCWPVSGSMIG